MRLLAWEQLTCICRRDSRLNDGRLVNTEGHWGPVLRFLCLLPPCFQCLPHAPYLLQLLMEAILCLEGQWVHLLLPEAAGLAMGRPYKADPIARGTLMLLHVLS